jgi:hypothetical protein
MLTEQRIEAGRRIGGFVWNARRSGILECR